jgi:hypothetical protein
MRGNDKNPRRHFVPYAKLDAQMDGRSRNLLPILPNDMLKTACALRLQNELRRPLPV